MARVTIEDCTKVIPSRFELVVIAAQRAKEISGGARLTVDRENDKNAVVALREIAEKTVDIEFLRDAVIKKHMVMQANADKDSPGDEFDSDSDLSQDVLSEIRKFEGDDSEDSLDDSFMDIEEEEIGNA